MTRATPLSADSRAASPSRVVHHADAVAWLRARGRLDGCSIVTSLPDVSEMPALDLAAWARWFEEAAALVLDAVPDEGVAVFFQSDIKRGGAWIDKGAMVQRAADRAGARLLFHRIVCRKPPGTVTFGRAAYSHLLGYSRAAPPPPSRAQRGSVPQGLRHGLSGPTSPPPRPGRSAAAVATLPAPPTSSAAVAARSERQELQGPSRGPCPDVLADPGFQPGTKSMGVKVCAEVCRYVLRETPTRTVVDPFCGYGTVLAVANLLGLAAVGVDLSARMCKKSRALTVELVPGLA